MLAFTLLSAKRATLRCYDMVAAVVALSENMRPHIIFRCCAAYAGVAAAAMRYADAMPCYMPIILLDMMMRRYFADILLLMLLRCHAYVMLCY